MAIDSRSALYPFGSLERLQGLNFFGRQRPVVEIRGRTGVRCLSVGIDFDELHPLGHDAAIAGAVGAGVLDGVFQEEQSARLVGLIGVIDKNRPAFQQVAMPLDDEVERGIEQRMAGADKASERLAGKADEALLEGDPLVARENGFSASDLPVAIANDGGDVLDLEALRLPLVDRPAQQLERLDEERGDEVRLKPAGLGPFHVLADLPDPGDIHRIVCQGALSTSSRRCWRSSALSTTLKRRAFTSGSSP